MKVLFYDGQLDRFRDADWEDLKTILCGFFDDGWDWSVFFVDAKYGPKSNENEIHDFINYKHTMIENQNLVDIIIITNSLVALDNTYCWGEETNSCELYIYDKRKDEFVKAQDLTEKEIKQGHNLEALYRNGAFDLEDGND